MKFGYTIIYVADVEETIFFYKKAFGFNPLFIDESKSYGELDTGATKLAFVSEKLAKTNVGAFKANVINDLPCGFEIGLIANDVGEAYLHACKNGAVSVQEPSEKPWGQKVAYVRDINGILIEICSLLKEE